MAGARYHVSNRGAGVAGARASDDGPTLSQDNNNHYGGRSARPWWRPRPPRIRARARHLRPVAAPERAAIERRGLYYARQPVPGTMGDDRNTGDTTQHWGYA